MFTVRVNGRYLESGRVNGPRTEQFENAFFWKDSKYNNVQEMLANAKCIGKNVDFLDENGLLYDPTVDDAVETFDVSAPIRTDIDRLILSLTSVLNGRQGTERRLRARLQELDKEINDLLHACELQDCDVIQGHCLYLRLHNARVERREVKDELAKFQALERANISQVDIEPLKRYLVQSSERIYNVRSERAREVFGGRDAICIGGAR